MLANKLMAVIASLGVFIKPSDPIVIDQMPTGANPESGWVYSPYSLHLAPS